MAHCTQYLGKNQNKVLTDSICKSIQSNRGNRIYLNNHNIE